MDIEKFISKAKQDYEMQKCWNDTEPQTHWEWIENYFRELHKLSFPLKRVVSTKIAGKWMIRQIGFAYEKCWYYETEEELNEAMQKFLDTDYYGYNYEKYYIEKR